ncbi:AtpZ/AtpI family protein [Aequorivita sp. H23M31]|uniref:AtpZ/AtpI family protein n=1 Tax=Aequorivita ciconiae TaxID=2494375 RepID=A0A410G4D5_9FLAO|nr:AtpZ/AtpI family protein [Aequorivita sp. H23M31]QAA82116.1 AtpZ/AtpI family protein [Aequorivita sp. H23M31]
MSDDGKKGLKNWAVFSGIAIQMGVTIGLAAFIGVKLDENYPNKYPIYTIILSLFGVFISLYALIKQLQKLNKDE